MELDNRISAEEALAAFENGMQAIANAGISLAQAVDYCAVAEAYRAAEEAGISATEAAFREAEKRAQGWADDLYKTTALYFSTEDAERIAELMERLKETPGKVFAFDACPPGMCFVVPGKYERAIIQRGESNE